MLLNGRIYLRILGTVKGFKGSHARSIYLTYPLMISADVDDANAHMNIMFAAYKLSDTYIVLHTGQRIRHVDLLKSSLLNSISYYKGRLLIIKGL